MLLALDTSTLTLSLALVDGVAPLRVVEHLLIGPPRKQSEMLPAVIGELLDRHGVKLASLEGIVVGLGPGSFTGLRIGLSAAKALAYAARLPLAGGSSLAAVAQEGPPDVPLFCLAVVRAQELYVGRYRRTGSRVEALAPEDALTPAKLAEAMQKEPEAIALGPAVPEYRAQLEGLGVPAARLLDVGTVPSAVALAQQVTLPKSFDAQALFALEPHYVRGSGAERNPRFPAPAGWSATARLKED
ncbi:MAG: tRNA (adenosine(37)-N6)-threonylcarbamoyltransferase complex dimerization subunit type 1 TsaB [Myxococcaceae bacterium]|nr:tRNA (adenosine(37)-N6)-threonylcarbamoyltransferase complex dimerization subunit type 1 TsaB [Myxococcaceae bacterium]